MFLENSFKENDVTRRRRHTLVWSLILPSRTLPSCTTIFLLEAHLLHFHSNTHYSCPSYWLDLISFCIINRWYSKILLLFIKLSSLLKIIFRDLYRSLWKTPKFCPTLNFFLSHSHQALATNRLSVAGILPNILHKTLQTTSSNVFLKRKQKSEFSLTIFQAIYTQNRLSLPSSHHTRLQILIITTYLKCSDRHSKGSYLLG